MIGMAVIVIAEDDIRPLLKNTRFDIFDIVLSRKGVLFNKRRMEIRSVRLHKSRLRDQSLSVIGIIKMLVKISIAVSEKNDIILCYADF